MQNPQQEIAMQIAQALQQGADPRELMGELVKMGMAQDQAASMIQSVMESIQGESQQMSKGGYTGTWSGNQGFAHGGISPYMYDDPYSTIMAMGGNIPSLIKKQAGGEQGFGMSEVPQEQNFPDKRSYLKAMNDYFNNLYLPIVGNEDYTADVADSLPEDDTTGYQNPALVALSTPQGFTPQQAAATTPMSNTSTARTYGTPRPDISIVDLLNSLGAKSDYKSRAKMAEILGMTSYRGRDYENADLIKFVNKYRDKIVGNSQGTTSPITSTNQQQAAMDTLPGMLDASRNVTLPFLDSARSKANNKTPYLGNTKKVNKSSSFFNNPDVTGTIQAVGIPAAAYATYDVISKYNKYAKQGLTKADAALATTFRNQLISTGEKNILGVINDWNKIPKRMQQVLLKDAEVKMMLDEARAEETLINAFETNEGLRAVEGDAAIGKTASKAAESARLARIASRAKKATKATGEFIKGFGRALRSSKFEMGGSYVPEYGQFAYGGYHSEIPGLFNQPVDRMNKAVPMASGGSFDNPGFEALPEYVQEKIMRASGKAMYGMGMASGGQMPQWLAERRFSAAGNRDMMSEYGYQKGGIVEIDPEDYEATIQRLRDGGYQFEVLR